MKWILAANIEGHEDIVDAFKKSSDIKDLPEQYVIVSDEYYVDYNTSHMEESKISKTMPYVPRRGTLTEATKIGRDEPDIFYKLLAKKDYGGSYGSVYTTPCDLLFVRTKHKQIYKTIHKVKMYVDDDYHKQITKICEARGETIAQAGARMIRMQNSLSMNTQFYFEGTRLKPIRINAAEYDARKRRERRIKQATPSWANKKEIDSLHVMIWRMNKEAGFIKYHLDHEIPLYAVNENGEHIACGLNIHQNLKPMLAYDNVKKSNIMRAA